MTKPAERAEAGRRAIPGQQNFLAGAFLVAVAILAIWMTKDLPQGTLRAMGPAMLPRWLAAAVGMSGLALLARGLLRSGESVERTGLRGPFFVLLAIVAFAVTIRPFAFGTFTTPGLGLVFAGPLAVMISGYASEEARWRELIVIALTLTPLSMFLFADWLNLPIPVFPQQLAGLFKETWSQKDILRVTALCLLALAAMIHLASRRSRRMHAAHAVLTQGGE